MKARNSPGRAPAEGCNELHPHRGASEKSGHQPLRAPLAVPHTRAAVDCDNAASSRARSECFALRGTAGSVFHLPPRAPSAPGSQERVEARAGLSPVLARWLQKPWSAPILDCPSLTIAPEETA